MTVRPSGWKTSGNPHTKQEEEMLVFWDTVYLKDSERPNVDLLSPAHPMGSHHPKGSYRYRYERINSARGGSDSQLYMAATAGTYLDDQFRY